MDTKTQDPHVSIDDAVAYAGSQSELGRLLGVSRQVVWYWKHSGSIPPVWRYRFLELQRIRETGSR